MALLDKISEDLQVPQTILAEALLDSRRLVRHIYIPKKGNRFRVVYQPSKKLKIIQYWLMHNVFPSMQVHQCATAYVKGASIKNNAQRHKKNKYFLKVDFKDFFPSITFCDLLPLLDQWRKNISHGWQLNAKAKNIIRLACFYKQDRLAIGYPTSPIISNIVMFKFDVMVTDFLESHQQRIGQAVYTRYADDLTFSTNIKNSCKFIYNGIAQIVKEMQTPKLAINKDKTRFVSAPGGSAVITGIRICHDGHLTLHRKYKDKVRLLLSLYEKGRLKIQDIPKLIGHLTYIQWADPVYYTKLQEKYFVSIDALMNP